MRRPKRLRLQRPPTPPVVAIARAPPLLLFVLSLVLVLSCAPAGAAAASGTVWATPHAQYSSSVGVLGCKINTNRVAYWPASVDCTNICIELSHGGRSVRLLRIDQSEGAFDVSYDAWNYLVTGASATVRPTAGGATPMEYRDLPASDCADLIHTRGGALPLSASNSMNFLASCIGQPSSWVARNYILFNVLDPVCSWGFDEECVLNNFPAENQAKCASGLGVPAVLTSAPVYNIEYPTGRTLLASSGQVVASPPGESAAGETSGRGRLAPRHAVGLLLTIASGLFFASLLFPSP